MNSAEIFETAKRVAFRVLRNPSEAEDTAQRVCVRLCQFADKPITKALVVQTAKGIASDMNNSAAARKKRERGYASSQERGFVRFLEREYMPTKGSEVWHQLQRLISEAELEPLQTEVLNMTLEGFTQREIAKALKKSRRGVANAYARGIDALQSMTSS